MIYNTSGHYFYFLILILVFNESMKKKKTILSFLLYYNKTVYILVSLDMMHPLRWKLHQGFYLFYH